MSWTYELQIIGEPDGKWNRVNVFFATEAEARRAGQQKHWAWTMCQDYRVVESDQEVNTVNLPDPPAA